MSNRAASKRNSVRIIGGELRSRKIVFEELPGLRPTSDRIRETLFNWLRETIRAENCLDLFAGSGALGIEALSRGAGRVVFVEKNPAASKMIRENLELFEVANADLICTDALSWLRTSANIDWQFGIVFLDPPFADESIYQVCSELDTGNFLKPTCRIYIESAEIILEANLPDNWELIRQKKAGQVYYHLFQKSN